MSYKVGDKVQIRADLHKDSYWCGSGVAVTEDMVRYAGKEVTISKVRHNRRYSIEEDKGAWTWHETVFDIPITTEPTKKTTTNDPVSNPSHYTGNGRIQPIKYIQDKSLNFARGNVVKYVTRAGHKPEGDKKQELEDLRKARQYLDFEINHLEGRV